MCFFSPDGDLEIQERPPRYRGEPRRKRLAFVKERSSRGSDDWDARTYRSSNRSSNRSSVPDMRQRGYDSPPPRYVEPRWSGQQPPYGPNPFRLPQAPHGQHPGFGQQLPHGQIPIGGPHPQHGQHPAFNPQAHYGQPPLLNQPPQFAQMRPQQPPSAGMMAQPIPIRPLPPGGLQQPLGGGRGNDNDIVEIIEPGRGQGHFGGRDQQRIEDGPRARMPRNMEHNHGRGRSRHRDHRRRDESVYSFDDDDDSFGSGQRLFRGPRSGWNSDSDDSFASPLRSPRRRDSRYRR